MKKIQYIISIGIVIFALGIPSCNDDNFLEEKPTTFYTIDNVFSTSEQVDQILVGIYATLREFWINPNEQQWRFNFKGKGTDMYGVANIRKGNIFSDYGILSPDTDTYYQVYSVWYYIISRANLALYVAELPQISWSSSEDKAYTLAQAKFFRAFAYKNLGELYGGVPIVEEITTSPRYDYIRASRVETYQFAIDDLETILMDLPETTQSGGRLVRGAAQHNLSELYLAMGIQLTADDKTSDAQVAFRKSIDYADQLVDGNIYSLITERFGTRKNEETFYIDIHENGQAVNAVVDTIQFKANYYWDLFQEGNINYQEGNTESIWTLQIDYDAFKQEDTKSRLRYSRYYGPVFRNMSNGGFAGTLEDIGGFGVSYVNLTMYARDEIYKGEYTNDLRNSEAVFRRRFKGNVSSSPYYRKVVPWDFIYFGSADQTANINNRSIVYPVSCKIATDKYTGIEEGQDRSTLFRDEYMIRLSETILLRAEAKQRIGDKAGAAADINLLRDRAQCTYRVTAADMDDNFDMILDERARELIYEEPRWNTLLRMGGKIAVERIRKYQFWPETAATLTFDYNLWPIPQTVIDTNKDVVLEQNPGWINK